MIRIIADLLVWVILIILWGYNDGRRNERGLGIWPADNHGMAFMLRYIAAFLITLLVLYGWNDPPGLVHWIAVMANKGAIAWIVFDFSYVFARKLPADYLGTTSWLDRIFKSWTIQFIVKLIYLIGSIIFRMLV